MGKLVQGIQYHHLWRTRWLQSHQRDGQQRTKDVVQVHRCLGQVQRRLRLLRHGFGKAGQSNAHHGRHGPKHIGRLALGQVVMSAKVPSHGVVSETVQEDRRHHGLAGAAVSSQPKGCVESITIIFGIRRGGLALQGLLCILP